METPLPAATIFFISFRLEIKYRDIADGNQAAAAASSRIGSLEIKYRDIADGNRAFVSSFHISNVVGNQVPRYSGWKRQVRGQFRPLQGGSLEIKYRDIADGNHSILE